MRVPTALALYAGRASTLRTATGIVPTAIAKLPVTGRVRVGHDGVPGDEQVFHSHGGPDRAVCVYPSEHYERWGARVHPAFGENLTSQGVLETATRIGDVWRIGGALLQVSQPRSPCAKVAARLGVPGLVVQARRSRSTGLHLRVLEPGELGAGDAIELVEPATHAITVADAVAARFDPAPDPGLVRAVLDLPELAIEWRTKTAPRGAQAA